MQHSGRQLKKKTNILSGVCRFPKQAHHIRSSCQILPPPPTRSAVNERVAPGMITLSVIKNRILTNITKPLRVARLIAPHANPRCSLPVVETRAAARFMSSEAKRLRSENMSATKIGTHNGSFHCDEVLACFLLRQLPEYKVRGEANVWLMLHQLCNTTVCDVCFVTNPNTAGTSGCNWILQVSVDRCVLVVLWCGSYVTVTPCNATTHQTGVLLDRKILISLKQNKIHNISSSNIINYNIICQVERAKCSLDSCVSTLSFLVPFYKVTQCYCQCVSRNWLSCNRCWCSIPFPGCWDRSDPGPGEAGRVRHCCRCGRRVRPEEASLWPSPEVRHWHGAAAKIWVYMDMDISRAQM